jgi:phage gpG-like protein
MIRVSGRVRGIQETQAVLRQAEPILMDEMDASARAAAFQVTRTAQKNYLSGPRPTRLGVVTNRLRGSLSEGAPDFVFDLQRQQARITVRTGTNVEYAPAHEFGAIIKPKKGRYLAIPTALAKTPAGALKGQYAGGLRQIQDLFIQRSKSGVLFAARKAPATGRQRRSGFEVLFWLVKSVKIPARPFLSSSLKDNVQWINDRFNQGLRRVERRLSALFRGR